MARHLQMDELTDATKLIPIIKDTMMEQTNEKMIKRPHQYMTMEWMKGKIIKRHRRSIGTHMNALYVGNGIPVALQWLDMKWKITTHPVHLTQMPINLCPTRMMIMSKKPLKTCIRVSGWFLKFCSAHTSIFFKMIHNRASRMGKKKTPKTHWTIQKDCFAEWACLW